MNIIYIYLKTPQKHTLCCTKNNNFVWQKSLRASSENSTQPQNAQSRYKNAARQGLETYLIKIKRKVSVS